MNEWMSFPCSGNEFNCSLAVWLFWISGLFFIIPWRSLDQRVTKVLSSFTGPSNFNYQKSPWSHPLGSGGSGRPGRKGTPLPGSVALKWPSPQPAGFMCAGLSLVTLVLFPARGGFPQVVDLWDLQISQCDATSFLSLGYFSSGKGNNFLKFIWMWKKAMFLVILVVFIVQNKNSKKEKKSLCKNWNSYTIKFGSLLPLTKKRWGGKKLKTPYFNCPKVEIHTPLWKLLGLSDGRRARLGQRGASGKEQLASGSGSRLSGSSAPSSEAAESGVAMTRCRRDSGATLQKRPEPAASSRVQGLRLRSAELSVFLQMFWRCFCVFPSLPRYCALLMTTIYYLQ